MKDFCSAIACIRKKDLIINREYEALLRDIGFDGFESVWHHPAGETVKSIAPRSVVRFSVIHRDVSRSLFLKRHNLEFTGFRGLLGLLLNRKGATQGTLEFWNICAFRKNGLQTVSPVAAGEKFYRIFWAQSFLITEDFYPYVSLEYLLKSNPGFFSGREGEDRKKYLIKEIGGLARKMHNKGFNHQDFNATHILLYYPRDSDIPQIALFDMQRVEKNIFFRFRWKIKSLARLNYSLPAEIFSEQDRIDILLFYNCKSHPDFTDRVQWLWIRKKTARIKRHTEKHHIRKNKDDKIDDVSHSCL
ncbi:MAG: lipopolysaccharide kinase InaA family protein [Desulfosalsimonadaceae bacterium]